MYTREINVCGDNVGILEDIVGRIFNKAKDDLTYKAGNVASDTIAGGVGQGVNKIKGEKGEIKTLEKCPKCKVKLEPDVKFCPECGFRLIVKCEKCNVEYIIGTKFCKQCGEAVK